MKSLALIRNEDLDAITVTPEFFNRGSQDVEIPDIAQCCQVKGNEEEVNHEEHREHEEKKEILDKILRELCVLRGEKFLIVRHWISLGGSGVSRWNFGNDTGSK